MSKANRGFLDGAYALENAEATMTLYRGWAATYEEEVRANGYATPTRCAEALACVVEDKTAPLLDLGCGTGLSGEAFKTAGFTTVDGTDFSEEMLACARGKPLLYRKLVTSDLSKPLPAVSGDYAHVAAVGVFSPGHASADMIDEVTAILPPSGCFVFSLNDHALEDPSYDEHIRALVDAGTAEIAFKEYGDHLPRRQLKAVVCVLRIV